MNVVTNELVAAVVLPLVAMLAGKAFAWWKARAREKEDARYVTAVEAFEVGVQQAWTSLGRQWKAAHEDGKFTDEEKQSLRDHAVETAREVDPPLFHNPCSWRPHRRRRRTGFHANMPHRAHPRRKCPCGVEIQPNRLAFTPPERVHCGTPARPVASPAFREPRGGLRWTTW